MNNTWPGDNRRALTQDEHRKWNAGNNPGTLDICAECDGPTGSAGAEDAILNSNGESICEECAQAAEVE